MWIEVDGIRTEYEEVEAYFVALELLSKGTKDFECPAFKCVFPK